MTRMDAPLGREVGNANEVVESIETLKGNGPPDLEKLSVMLAARMLVLARLAPDQAAADLAVRKALASGAGLEAFRRIIEHQGGDPAVIDDYSRLPALRISIVPRPSRGRCVTWMPSSWAGLPWYSGPAGRRSTSPTTAWESPCWCRPAQLWAGRAIFLVRHRGGRGLDEALALLEEAVHIGGEPCPQEPLVLDVRQPED